MMLPTLISPSLAPGPYLGCARAGAAASAQTTANTRRLVLAMVSPPAGFCGCGACAMISPSHPVPRTRSSHRNCRESDCELRVQIGTRIIELLVSFDFEVRYGACGKLGRTSASGHQRSEEHTSELQSRFGISYA